MATPIEALNDITAESMQALENVGKTAASSEASTAFSFTPTSSTALNDITAESMQALENVGTTATTETTVTAGAGGGEAVATSTIGATLKSFAINAGTTIAIDIAARMAFKIIDYNIRTEMLKNDYRSDATDNQSTINICRVALHNLDKLRNRADGDNRG